MGAMVMAMVMVMAMGWEVHWRPELPAHPMSVMGKEKVRAKAEAEAEVETAGMEAGEVEVEEAGQAVQMCFQKKGS